MTKSARLQKVDPILLRLQAWQLREGLNRTSMAARLGVSRTAVAGWLLALEAQQSGKRDIPASGRVFRFLDQSAEVQAAIADALGEPVQGLRDESLGSLAVTKVAAAPPTGELFDVGRRVLARMTMGAALPAGSLTHRIAEVVEAITRAPTIVWPEFRGSDRQEPYQYQVVVLASGNSPEGLTDDEVKNLVKRINDALADSGLPAHWEHGAMIPCVTITLDDKPVWHRLGSLVVPHVAMPRPAQVGLLARPKNDKIAQRQLRLMSVVTAPYGGSDPIAGHLAMALGAGHLRASDVGQAFHDAMAEHRSETDRRALRDTASIFDAGYSTQKALNLLQEGAIAGAWIYSLEVEHAAVFQPLMDDLVSSPAALVAVRLGEQWRRLAAWRLAAATLNMAGRKGGKPEPWSSDQVDFVAAAGEVELGILTRQAEEAARQEERLKVWDDALARLIADRRRVHSNATPRPTLEYVLESLPDDSLDGSLPPGPSAGRAMRFDDSHWTPVTGYERFEGKVAFPDAVDGLMDAWTECAARVADWLAQLAGHDGADALLPAMHEGPVRRLLVADRP